MDITSMDRIQMAQVREQQLTLSVSYKRKKIQIIPEQEDLLRMIKLSSRLSKSLSQDLIV